MIGQTISHYKILEKIGEGGMGIVYKAHDTKLDRDVALKFLPREVSLSEEERNRFIHEAKAASALEHPNICTIHEVGETPDGQMFIVMGYYDGIPISRKVDRGRLDLSDAVAIAIQIAEGLQAAHEKGIVHRDIKSSNIIVSEKGQVRILDFGLARKSGLSKLTKTGTTVGTASYMSPEQARGETIDHRSDLWSLGIVLYEMVTGKLPFRGDHEAAILYSVVNEEPKPLEVSISSTSPELIHIIGRALEKDVTERYQSAAEMLVDLKRLRKETSRTGYKPVGSGTGRSGYRRKRILYYAGTGILMVAAFVVILFLMKKSTDINPDWAYHPLQIPIKDMSYPGISGDGNWIAFSGYDRDGTCNVYLMNIQRGGPRRITTIPSASWVDLSADGSILLYAVYEKNQIDWYTIYTNGGGEPQRIIHGGYGQSPRFRPDGQRVGYLRGVFREFPTTSGKMEFWSVGIGGTDPRREFIDSVSTIGGISYSFCYSPDGRKVSWLRSIQGYQEIMIRDLEKGAESQITSDKKIINEIAWVREDKIIYTTNKGGIFNVWMVSTTGGEPIQITKGVEDAGGVKASLDGQKIIYTLKSTLSDLWIVNITTNRPKQITFTEEFLLSPMFSPDNNKIAFVISGNYRPSHIFVMNRDGTNKQQLSFGDEVVSIPFWSPDGRRIAYGSKKISEPEDSLRTYVVDVSNPGSPKCITRGEARYWLDSTRFQVKLNGKFYITSVNAAPPTEVYDDSTVALITPGGKYILYQDHRQGKDRKVWWITDATKPRDVQRKTARVLPWHIPDIKFSGDGKTAYAVGDVGEIWRIGLPDGKEERIPAGFLGVDNFWVFSPSWDGKEIIIVKTRSPLNIVMIENLFK